MEQQLDTVCPLKLIRSSLSANEKESQEKKHVSSLRDLKVENAYHLWVHRIEHNTMFSWRCFRQQKPLGLVGASKHKELKSKMGQSSFPPSRYLKS